MLIYLLRKLMPTDPQMEDKMCSVQYGNPFFTSPLGFSFEMMCPVVSCHGKLVFIANLYYAYQVALDFLVRFIDPVCGTLIDRNPVATHTWYAILQTGFVGIIVACWIMLLACLNKSTENVDWKQSFRGYKRLVNVTCSSSLTKPLLHSFDLNLV